MAEQIRPTRIFRPRRVRRPAREDREENEERFRKKLAEQLAAEADADDATGKRSPRPAPGSKAEQADPAPEDDDDSTVGRNLDLRT